MQFLENIDIKPQKDVVSHTEHKALADTPASITLQT
jgi:hypothetical protein